MFPYVNVSISHFSLRERFQSETNELASLVSFIRVCVYFLLFFFYWCAHSVDNIRGSLIRLFLGYEMMININSWWASLLFLICFEHRTNASQPNFNGDLIHVRLANCENYFWRKESMWNFAEIVSYKNWGIFLWLFYLASKLNARTKSSYL